MTLGDTEDMNLRALVFQLKNPLVNIARLAELGDEQTPYNIQSTAEQALMLIDSYLLHAQTEYGQVALDLEPACLGSVLYDVSAQMRERANWHNIDLVIDDRVSEPVMTHRPALNTIMNVFGETLLGAHREKTSKNMNIVLRGYKTRAGNLGIGMFSEVKLSQDDIRRAMQLQGRAHMPLSALSNSAHVSLAIAEGLCRAIGGSMTVKHMGGLSGFATELPRSEQLALV
jgi:hypothetical protein